MAPRPKPLRIEATRDGRVTALEIGEATVLVGTGSHCDLRLLPDEAAREHLRIEYRGGQVFAQALSQSPPCQRAGQLFVEGLIEAGGELQIGELTLRFEGMLDADADAEGPSRRDGLPPAVQVGALIALAIGFYFALHRPAQGDPLARVPEAPALFAGAPQACPAGSRDEAAFEAERQLREADLQRERAPFHTRVGLEAVALYERAAACFERVGASDEARSAAQQAGRLRESFAAEYRVRRVRLERLLARKKWVEAQQEVAILQDFLARRSEPYTHWLASVERSLSTRFARAERTR